MPLHFEIFNQFLRKYVEFTDAELTDFNNKLLTINDHFNSVNNFDQFIYKTL
jgi:hypothetical protein